MTTDANTTVRETTSSTWALWLDASGEPQTATEADWDRLVATGCA